MNENKRTAKFTFTKVSMVMLLYELIFQVGRPFPRCCRIR